MNLWTLVAVAIGVSADAFAVSLAQGVRVRRQLVRAAIRVGLAFGVFQAAMPLLGWTLGAGFADLIAPVDHWIAFALLLAIGGKMLWEAFGSDDGGRPGRLRTRELLALSLATSIDALAVGLGFAFLEVDIVPAVLLIGAVTAVLSAAGVLLGHRVGTRFRRPAEIGGGVILIGIGVKILVEHLAA